MTDSRPWLLGGITVVVLTMVLLLSWWLASSTEERETTIATLDSGTRGHDAATLPGAFQTASPPASRPLPVARPVVPLGTQRPARSDQRNTKPAAEELGAWARVRIVVGTAAGVVPQGLAVLAWGDIGLLARHETILTVPPEGSGVTGRARVLRQPIPPTGRLVLRELRPLKQMAVCVVDSDRTLIWGPKRFRTDPTKPFDIRAELSIEAGDIPVIVQDRGGAPVVGAEVRAVHRREKRSGTTDTQGRFVVTGWTDDLVDLIVRQPGHGLFVRWNLAVPPPGQPIRVTLPQDLTVSVRVVDWTGLDVPEGRLTARIGHERIPGEEAVGSSRRDAHGCRVLTGLPPRPVTLVATVSGREFEQVHDPRLADHSTITLPGHGSITLSWRQPLDRALEYTLTLSGKFVDGGSLQRPLTADEVAASEMKLPVVFEGRYRAQIFRIERTPEKVSWRVALENSDIEVTAHNRTRAMLAPP